MKLIFATNNVHKLQEVSALLNKKTTLILLKEAGINEDLPETANTLTENALQKARYIYTKTGENCFADDSGLEVEALNYEPGVYSARYAGPQRNDKDNLRKVLQQLENKINRKAHFKTVLALIINGQELLFEGKIEGVITIEEKGASGFGYDPIFLPNGHAKTFAEMSPEEKNAISHRKNAVAKMNAFLEGLKC